jgi:hypothetical protein
MTYSLHKTLNNAVSDLCGLNCFHTLRLTAAQHLRAWFLSEPRRMRLISARALDELSGRPLGTFSRFLQGEKYVNFERAGVAEYYPCLRLLGYQPPTDTGEALNVAPAG